eukprot:11891062-Alexandrium_andersonii.AAC.1
MVVESWLNARDVVVAYRRVPMESKPQHIRNHITCMFAHWCAPGVFSPSHPYWLSINLPMRHR